MHRKEALERDEPKCLLDVLIKVAEANSDFTDEDIINETVTFMLAVSFFSNYYFSLIQT